MSIADGIPTVGIDFGYCGVNQISTRTFILSNPNHGTVRYEVLTENCPFTLSPSQGT
jgi:hypothetical protein